MYLREAPKLRNTEESNSELKAENTTPRKLYEFIYNLCWICEP